MYLALTRALAGISGAINAMQGAGTRVCAAQTPISLRPEPSIGIFIHKEMFLTCARASASALGVAAAHLALTAFSAQPTAHTHV